MMLNCEMLAFRTNDNFSYYSHEWEQVIFIVKSFATSAFQTSHILPSHSSSYYNHFLTA